MALHRLCVHANHFCQGVQSHVPDIVVLVPQKSAGAIEIRDLLLLLFRLSASVDKLLTSEEEEYKQRRVGQKAYTVERHYMEQELLELSNKTVKESVNCCLALLRVCSIETYNQQMNV